jgi:hypothetical protein
MPWTCAPGNLAASAATAACRRSWQQAQEAFMQCWMRRQPAAERPVPNVDRHRSVAASQDDTSGSAPSHVKNHRGVVCCTVVQTQDAGAFEVRVTGRWTDGQTDGRTDRVWDGGGFGYFVSGTEHHAVVPSQELLSHREPQPLAPARDHHSSWLPCSGLCRTPTADYLHPLGSDGPTC